jgi:hypothetical protein
VEEDVCEDNYELSFTVSYSVHLIILPKINITYSLLCKILEIKTVTEFIK